ncbi:MAG: type VI-B CRISPR-associated RNA-guided ribonuclease Cas13b [Prevotellaceae bacterium]|jgi:hypothetical protein|nr:type VI-B CRISPR-associated RNA-guided ribonuclease Cas13b [Prevotellaceae bacterium]
MTTNEPLPGKKMYTFEESPQYFGGYLKIASHNILNINNHVAQKLNLPLSENENSVVSSFFQTDNHKNLSRNHAYNIVLRFMPFVKVFDFEQLPFKMRAKIEKQSGLPDYTKDFALMRETLSEIFKDLEAFQKDYTHYYSTQKATKRKITVSPKTAEFLNRAFHLAIQYTKIRMKDALKEEDYSLVKRKTMIEKQLTVRSEHMITADGLVFLICMFLEREQAFRFINRIRGLKGVQYSRFIAMREVLMTFCIKQPGDKFVSEDVRQVLVPEMIDELNRCPKTLYAVISEKEKKRFRPELDMAKQQKMIDNNLNQDDMEDWDEPTYDDYIGQVTKRIRYDNRFAYFAMRYIDEMNVFPSLRFHLDLGKLELANYHKRLAGKAVPRRIVENVRAFGKWNEYADESTAYARVDSRKLTVGFDRFTPHYNADNNKIGLCRGSKNAELIEAPNAVNNRPYRLKQPSPDAFLSLYELPKIVLLEYLEKGEAENIINAFIDLSSKKLLSKAFIKEIKSKLPKEWNEFRKRSGPSGKTAYPDRELKRLQFRKTCLNDILNNYGLNVKQIPARILHYWLNIVDVDEVQSFADRIRLMRHDCIKRLRVMEKHVSSNMPKVGEMASFLAKDIVDMVVDKDKKQRITSFYYNKIQECLALFADDEKKNLFFLVLNELKLHEVGGHPFLWKVLQQEELGNTAQFYVAYLKEKADKKEPQFNPKTHRTNMIDTSWIYATFYVTEWDREKGRKATVVRMPADTSDIPFTVCQWVQKDRQDLDKWLDNITQETNGARKAVDLPTDLFDAKLCELLGKELTKANVEHDPASNYNQLLKLWWESRGDSMQDFYRSERKYEVYGEKINFRPNSKSKFKDYYDAALKRIIVKNKKESVKQTIDQLERVFKRAIAGTEKEIRLLQEEDRLMLLMVEQMMDSMENVQLTEIDRLSDDTILNRLTIGFDENGKVIINNHRTPAMTRTIVATCKRKNYTELRKYCNDRRLSGLFEYHQAEEIQLDWLKEQLSAYDRVRPYVFDMAFALEKRLINIDTAGVKNLFVDDDGKHKSGNIRHAPYLAWLREKGMISDAEKMFLNTVQDAFLQNQFPQPATMPEDMKWNGDLPLAEQIVSVYKQKIETIMNKMAKG